MKYVEIRKMDNGWLVKLGERDPGFTVWEKVFLCWESATEAAHRFLCGVTKDEDK